MLYVSEASITCSSYEPSRYHLFLTPTSCFLFFVSIRCFALHNLCRRCILICPHPITMPAKDASPTTTTIPADLSNGTSKDAIIEDLRRRLEESELSSNAGSSSSGARRRRRSRKPKSSFASNMTDTAAPFLPHLPTATATTKKTKTKEAKPVKLVVGLNLNLELELKARIQGDISLSLV
jgi:hypothetical protein